MNNNTITVFYNNGHISIRERRAWTGGDVPPLWIASSNFYNEFKAFRKFYFREQLKECGGLDLWKCAGTSALERARLFWNAATLDAWRTISS